MVLLATSEPSLMSAFLLSYTHINVLITFAKAQRLILPAPEAP